MTELCSADLCKLSVQEVADMLLEKLDEVDHTHAGCRVYGCSEGRMLLEKLDEVDHTHAGCRVYGCSEGRMFELSLVMKEVDKNGDN